MKLPRVILLSLAILLVFFAITTPVATAQQGTWQFDPQVTEVGKNAERARQLLYWIFTHPPSYNVPIFRQIWSISANTVFALFILVIAVTGLSYILSRRTGNLGPVFNGISSPIFGISIPTLFFRIGMLLIYIIFSFVIVLGFIQASDIISSFFVKTYGGCNLFNINFAGSGTNCNFDLSSLQTMEENYKTFVGHKDPNPLNQESVNTSLFLVKLTTLTYNLLAIMMILRQIILWFLLMVSPFLAILLPFLFIRNTGYIWIGVFFQWLFYGPLVALFLAGLVQIWEKGIPYAFNFNRINTPDGQVFPTSINILYGGPAQLLTPTNSANYVDTYAEYLIALIMLWTAIFLPWLLLRIFRDYCCDILRQNHAALLSILDKVRGVGTPPLPPSLGPIPTTQTGMQLPFRKPVEELRKISVERLQDISRANTYEITRSLSLSISSLSEVARYEMDRRENKQVVETLNRIANPFVIPQEKDRKLYSEIKSELETRAKSGDREAAQILSAAFKQPVVTPIPATREFPEITIAEAINSISRETALTSEKIREIIKEVSKTDTYTEVQTIATNINLPVSSVQQVVNMLPGYVPTGSDLTAFISENPQVTSDIAQKTGLSEEKVKEVLEKYSESTLTQTEKLEKIAKETNTSLEKVNQILEKLPDVIIKVYPQIFDDIAKNKEIIRYVSEQTSLSKEKVSEVLQKTVETIKQGEKELTGTKEVSADVAQVSKQTGVPATQVETIMKLSASKLPLNAPKLIAALTHNPTVIAALVKQSNMPEDSVKNILDHISRISPLKSHFEEQISEISEVSGVSKDQVKDVVGTVAAANLEKPKTEKTKPQPVKKPHVSVEDYEEVKNMWTNHYKNSEVPVSEKIKNRREWLNEDVQRLTNILNLLTSLSPKDKEKGNKELASVLPFLLLGGFSDVESVLYLKAKLQAAKVVLTHLEEQEKIKEQLKKEEEESLVEVPKEEKKEEEKTMQTEEQKAMEPPIDEKKNPQEPVK